MTTNLNLVNFIDPRCAAEVLAQEDRNVYVNCGKYSGYIGAAVITLVLLVLIYFIRRSYEKKPNETDEQQQERNKNKGKWIILCIVIIILSWFVSPKLSMYVSGNEWDVNDVMVNSYAKNMIISDPTMTDATKKIKARQELLTSKRLGDYNSAISGRGVPSAPTGFSAGLGAGLGNAVANSFLNDKYQVKFS